MENENLLLEIPYGTRDFLPGEASQKRKLENRLANLFASWGYEEVSTPVMEYLDTLVMGSGESIEEHLFKFFDSGNRTLALRHEMTTPIARLVTGRLKEAPLPLKLSYVGSVYRHEQTQAGRQCEFYQGGVELIGSDTPAADAEIIALAIETLRCAGLQNFRLCLGHVDYAQGLTVEYQLTEEQKEKIKHTIEAKNLVRLQKLTEKFPLSPTQRKTLNEIPLLYGDREILIKAKELAHNNRSYAALENLTEIYSILTHYGLTEYVSFDLGMIRDFGYYTGMVFEVYVPTLGYPLCGGGRYDNLLAGFGKDCPATGFAVGIERLMLALKDSHAKVPGNPPKVYVAYAEGKIAEAVAAASSLRAAGTAADLALVPQNESEAKLFADKNGYERLAYFD